VIIVKSLDELKDLREKAQKDIQNRETGDKVEIIVGMGTCGIAAGARDILQEIMKEIDKRDLDVIVSQTGCIGMCEKEPLVDVKLPGEDRVTYGEVETSDASKIISSHVVNGSVVDDLVVARLEE
jgi:NADP-reducing hydrogenase subunit HndB